jgi:hypothetical protein
MILPVNFSFPIVVHVHEIFIVFFVDHASGHDVLWVDPGDMRMYTCSRAPSFIVVCILHEEFPIKYVHFMLTTFPFYLTPSACPPIQVCLGHMKILRKVIRSTQYMQIVLCILRGCCLLAPRSCSHQCSPTVIRRWNSLFVLP